MAIPIKFFDRRTAFFLLFLCLPLLFFPKINLLSLSKTETAGIRLDDFVLLFLSIFLFWAHVTLEKSMSTIERWVTAFVLWSLLSFVTNRIFLALGLIPVGSSIFYCLRIFEYFLFFYIGAFSASFLSANRLITLFFVWNFAIMLLQKFSIIGMFASTGYIAVANDRLAGIGSFPSETGMLLNMVFAYMLYANHEKSPNTWTIFPMLQRFYQFTRIYWLFLLFAVLIALTGARIALAALVIIFGWRVLTELRKGSTASRILAVSFFSVGILLMATAVQHATSLIERSAGLISWRNIELIGKAWEHMDVSRLQEAQLEVKYENYDMSWWMRIHKWCYALKTYVTHPLNYIQGVGPGFATPALDGGLLRILTETGIVGSFIFTQIVLAIATLSRPLKWMVIGFLLNMIFFDVYLAYKPMSLLFFTAGSTYAASRTEQTSLHFSSQRAHF
jgi:hypothetical protein